MKYQELYQWGCNQLAEANIAEAGLDARLLLEEVCGTDRNYLLIHGDEAVEEEKCKRYTDFIADRKRHVPLQQIVGYQEFMGLRFRVTPDVLIPRQDTETLVEEAMRYANDCICVGCDISPKALAGARENTKDWGLAATFIESNLFEAIEGNYEIIVSNPPYIPSAVIPTLMEEVKDYEPLNALDGFEDGLYFYREITAKAKEYLCPGGMLFFEIGCEQAAAVSGYLKEAGYAEVTVCKDLAGLDRVVYGTYRG